MNRVDPLQTTLGKRGDDRDRPFVNIGALGREPRGKSNRLRILDVRRLDTFELQGRRNQEVVRSRVGIDVEVVIYLDAALLASAGLKTMATEEHNDALIDFVHQIRT